MTMDNYEGCDWYFGVPFKSKRKAAVAAVKEREFKVGDRVRCNGGYSFDPTGGTITEVSNGYCEVLVDDAGAWLDKSWSYQNDDLELLPHYARGARIQLLRDHGVYKAGHRGTVTYENDENVGALMDIGRYAAFPHEVVGVPDDNAPGCAGRKVERGDAPVAKPKPKFKAGDIVRCLMDIPGSFTKGKLYIVSEYPNRHGHVGVVADDSGETTNGWRQDFFKPVTWGVTSGHYGSCIVALINKDGKPRPSQWPHVHASVADATKEAERLARNNPGTEFAVYQRVAGRRAEVSVEMKEVA